MTHYPTPSPQPAIALAELLKSSDSRQRGKLIPPPVDGHISLSSIYSTSLFKKEFPIDSSALIQDARLGLTFRQLEEMSRRVAKILANKVYLICRHLNPHIQVFQEPPSNVFGECVFGMLSHGERFDERVVIFILAILKLGASYVHIHRDQVKTEEEWRLMIRRVQPIMFITFKNLDDTDNGNSNGNGSNSNQDDVWTSTIPCSINSDIGRLRLPLPHFVLAANELWEEALKAPKDREEVTPLKLKTPIGYRTAIVFPNYVPSNGIKWIRVCHRIIHNRISWEKMEFPIQEEEKFFLTYPIGDPRALVQLFLPLWNGRSVHIMNSGTFHGPRNYYQMCDPLGEGALNQMLNQISTRQMTRLSITPEHLEQLVNFVTKNGRQSDLASMKFWMVSGGQIIFDLELGKVFFKAVPNEGKCLLTIFYGSPDVLWAATWAMYPNFREMKRRSIDGKVCYGTPLYNMVITVVDDKNWRDCECGNKGEICISTLGLTSSGSDMPLNLFIQTGDLGRVIKDRAPYKVLLIDGKTNTRVKVKGRTIDFLEMGDKLKKSCCDSVDQCVVFVAPRTKDSQTLVAAYTISPGSSDDAITVPKIITLENAMKQVEPLLDSVMRVDRIPYSNGQVDARALRKSYHDFLVKTDDIDWVHILKKKHGPSPPSQEEIQCAKVLCKAIASSIAKPVGFIVKRLSESFWLLVENIMDEQGQLSGIGQAVRATKAIHAIRNQGYFLTPEDMISVESLRDLAKRMPYIQKQSSAWKREKDAVRKLVSYYMLRIEHWNDVVNLLKIDFDSKAKMFKPGSLERYWKRALDDIMKMNLSIVAFVDNTMVGCALNCSSIPKSEYIPVGMNKIFGLIQTAMDASKAETLTKGDGRLLQSFYIVVNSTILDNEGWKLVVLRDLLEKSMELGRADHKFGAYSVCTANPLVQEVATCLLNFRPLLELPMNRYKAGNFDKPFWDKDDHEKIGVYFKSLKNTLEDDISSRPSTASTNKDFDENANLGISNVSLQPKIKTDVENESP